ncbi:MAG: hypothetical protein HOK25_11925 [Rhodospirillaceae bacterium]|nr:hypothetical protein [Rhodospirillaceae bacterium]MBT5298041.1 hypothetical protein [Rhodospirillaceae bacterium]MBT5514777.1 hypothetical protein [Rhodospirillaceae bacterium]MBT7249229.1 hypothetical protein [Rhodospirillaceae bacterium]MBT7510478.1 hypothetical protein [Rhodospirillaceae bacterium]
MPLNHRQERFCRAFVQYGAAATAASEAGYAARSAKKAGLAVVAGRRHPPTYPRGAGGDCRASWPHRRSIDGQDGDRLSACPRRSSILRGGACRRIAGEIRPSGGQSAR